MSIIMSNLLPFLRDKPASPMTVAEGRAMTQNRDFQKTDSRATCAELSAANKHFSGNSYQ